MLNDLNKRTIAECGHLLAIYQNFQAKRGPGIRFPDEIAAEVKRLRDSGISQSEIALALAVSEDSVERWHRRGCMKVPLNCGHEEELEELAQAYAEFRKRYPLFYGSRVPEDIKTAALNLYNLGVSCSRMAYVMNLGVGTVNGWVRKQSKKPAVTSEASQGKAGENKSSQSEEWITVLIGGKKISVLKDDFLRLLKE